jgi:hypothetical protein
MALESQGVQIRRQSTTAGSTGSTSADTLVFTTVAGLGNDTITNTAGADFTAGVAFTTGMRLETDSTANSTRVFTIASVAATVMEVYEEVVGQSSGITVSLTGHEFEAIGEVTNFNGPTGSANIIDITHLGSTAKEKLMGLPDEGQITMDVNFNTDATALHLALKDDRAARTLTNFDIKLTDSSTFAQTQPTAFYFKAFVTNFSITGAVDDALKSALTLEISSAVRTIDLV